jgi:hypothetical protein
MGMHSQATERTHPNYHNTDMSYATPYDEANVQICCRRLKQKHMIIIEAEEGVVGRNAVMRMEVGLNDAVQCMVPVSLSHSCSL